MNQDILSYIMNHAGSLSLQEILVNFIAAIAVGGVISFPTVFHIPGPFTVENSTCPFGCSP